MDFLDQATQLQNSSCNTAYLLRIQWAYFSRGSSFFPRWLLQPHERRKSILRWGDIFGNVFKRRVCINKVQKASKCVWKRFRCYLGGGWMDVAINTCARRCKKCHAAAPERKYKTRKRHQRASLCRGTMRNMEIYSRRGGAGVNIVSLNGDKSKWTVLLRCGRLPGAHTAQTNTRTRSAAIINSGW